MNTLSVCIIAKNEERNLQRCLESIRGIADEVILVDTGSVDNTISIAEKYDAKVIKFPWQNNFSFARNKALEMASKDWILCIDCDEVLDSSQIYEMKSILNNSSILGFRLKLINIIGNKAYEGNHLLRIIKNNSGFYYSGKINEKLLNSTYKDSYFNEIMNLELLIYNFGFDFTKKSLVERCNRNIDIYLSYNEDKKNYLYYYYVGNEYYLLGKYTSATDNYLKALKSNNNNIYINSYITFLLIKSYYDMKKYNEAILLGKEFSIRYNIIRELYLSLSECYGKIGDTDKSKEYFKTYLSLKPNEYSYYFRLTYEIQKKLLPEFFGFSIITLGLNG
ncbi:glycosyltransferase [Clostridium nigeriense]|uniref:glycosyltransferase n=1 Tax=Clostridium nigeriense TaxID=1805470 RepID=UPI003D3454B9